MVSGGSESGDALIISLSQTDSERVACSQMPVAVALVAGGADAQGGQRGGVKPDGQVRSTICYLSTARNKALYAISVPLVT